MDFFNDPRNLFGSDQRLFHLRAYGLVSNPQCRRVGRNYFASFYVLSNLIVPCLPSSFTIVNVGMPTF